MIWQLFISCILSCGDYLQSCETCSKDVYDDDEKSETEGRENGIFHRTDDK